MHLPSASPPCLRHTQPLAQDWAHHKGSENLSHFTNIYCVVVLHQAPKLGVTERNKTGLHPSGGSLSRGHDRFSVHPEKVSISLSCDPQAI